VRIKRLAMLLCLIFGCLPGCSPLETGAHADATVDHSQVRRFRLVAIQREKADRYHVLFDTATAECWIQIVDPVSEDKRTWAKVTGDVPWKSGGNAVAGRFEIVPDLGDWFSVLDTISGRMWTIEKLRDLRADPEAQWVEIGPKRAKE